MSKVVNSTTTVADEMEFAALPIEVQELAKRVLGEQAGGYTENDMIEAYQAGFEDACEDYEVIPPSFHRSYAEDWVKYSR